jgi:hypothetical protein
MVKASSFKVGDSVVVKAKVLDPDFGVDIGGWQGRISDVRNKDNLVRIDWDSQTLQEMPSDFITQCEEQGFGWEQIYLEMTEVELTEARDTLAEVTKIYEQLQDKHAFDHLGPEGAGIRQVLAQIDSNDETAIWHAWELHLKTNLTFPFEAEIAEFQEQGPLQAGQKVTVQDLLMVDDLYGILAAVKHDRRIHHFPLCDLGVTNEKSPNYQVVKDYVMWFANR